MKCLPLLAAMLFAGTANAQGYDPLHRDGVTSGAPRASVEDAVYFLGRQGDTPTTRQQKLKWAIALKQRVAQWLVEDGGTLTPDHRYFVQRRVQKILS